MMRYTMLRLAGLFGAGAFALFDATPVTAQAVVSKHTAYGLIVCESRGRESFCPAETRYGVTLTRELSRGSCIEGRTWGRRRDGIWVSGGCAAEFELGSEARQTGGAYDPGYGNENDGVDSIRCESYNNRYQQCAVDTRGGVELIQQHSRGACIAGQTWGYEHGYIWVDRGCRAEFELGGRGYGPPGYGQPGYGDSDWGITGDEFLIRCESVDERQAFCPFDVGRAHGPL